MLSSVAGRAFRLFRRNPGFAAVAVLSLATGLGVSTAALALVEGERHGPDIPVADIDRVFELGLRDPNRSAPVPVAAQIEALRLIPGVAAVTAFRSENRSIEANGKIARSYIARVAGDFYTLLGVKPALGRLPSPDEIANESVVVLSSRFWLNNFGEHASLADAIVRIGDRPYHVAGVMPPGLENALGYGVVLPLPNSASFATERGGVIVKLREGVNIKKLTPTFDAIAARLVGHYARAAPPPAFIITDFKPQDYALNPFLWTLIVGGYSVLLIACANVAALMLARGLVKRRDYALRLALGASRLSLARDVCEELAVLAVIGSAAGGVVAYWSLRALTASIPQQLVLAGWNPPEWSVRVVLLSVASVGATLVLAGAVPAWSAMRTEPIEPLKESAGTTTGRAERRFHALLIAEFAISMVLVFSTALLLRSAQKYGAYDFGYDASKMVRAAVNLETVRDSATLGSGDRLADETVDRVRALPGVTGAAAFSPGSIDDAQVVSDFMVAGRDPVVLHRYWNVGAGFLPALGVPIVEGRDFSEGDRLGHGAVILTRRLAHQLFADVSAVGHLVKLGGVNDENAWLPVVGVIRDIDLAGRPNPQILPEPTLLLSGPGSHALAWSIVVRPAGDPAQLALRMSTLLRAALPVRAGTSVRPWLADYDQQRMIQQLINRIFGSLGLASLLLGTAGLFGVLTYAVGQRMREFAVRVALGAKPVDIARLVVRSALELTLGGVAIGTLLSVWAASIIGAGLYGIKPNDPVALVSTAVILTTITILAAAVPAIPAMRVDPVRVLRAF